MTPPGISYALEVAFFAAQRAFAATASFFLVAALTLHHLLQFGGWTNRTTQALVRNFHQFDAVSLERSPQRVEANGHYHRLNDDYQPIHELCRMFLACFTISEQVGAFGFKGFLLDMNLLFEQFVHGVVPQSVGIDSGTL